MGHDLVTNQWVPGLRGLVCDSMSKLWSLPKIVGSRLILFRFKLVVYLQLDDFVQVFVIVSVNQRVS